MTLESQIQISVEMYCFACKIQSCYISTDEVEMYCHRSRNQYFMVKKLRNYSTTAEATMTKFKLSCEAISLGGNPNNELSSYTGYWDIWPERQASKGLNSYFFHFFFIFVLPENYVLCPSHNWSKISSNQADFLQTHRGVKGVPGDA